MHDIWAVCKYLIKMNSAQIKENTQYVFMVFSHLIITRLKRLSLSIACSMRSLALAELKSEASRLRDIATGEIPEYLAGKRSWHAQAANQT